MNMTQDNEIQANNNHVVKRQGGRRSKKGDNARKAVEQMPWRVPFNIDKPTPRRHRSYRQCDHVRSRRGRY